MTPIYDLKNFVNKSCSFFKSISLIMLYLKSIVCFFEFQEKKTFISVYYCGGHLGFLIIAADMKSLPAINLKPKGSRIRSSHQKFLTFRLIFINFGTILPCIAHIWYKSVIISLVSFKIYYNIMFYDKNHS